MNIIEVFNQQQLDENPLDFHGRILIKFGTRYAPAVVRNYYRNSSVEAWENSSVVAWGNSSVVAWENSSVVAWGNSSVVALGNSSVEAWENSSVVALGNSSVVAWGNSQIVDCGSSSITTSGNAHIVYNPRTVDEYISFYPGIKETGDTVLLYKAVHKRDGKYFSDYDSAFEYIPGETCAVDRVSADAHEDCGEGIHIAHLDWCVTFGFSWADLAILEVEAKKSEIVVPLNGGGKVRTQSVNVIREVPLEECGLLGKTIARWRANT